MTRTTYPELMGSATFEVSALACIADERQCTCHCGSGKYDFWLNPMSCPRNFASRPSVSAK